MGFCIETRKIPSDDIVSSFVEGLVARVLSRPHGAPVYAAGLIMSVASIATRTRTER